MSLVGSIVAFGPSLWSAAKAAQETPISSDTVTAPLIQVMRFINLPPEATVTEKRRLRLQEPARPGARERDARLAVRGVLLPHRMSTNKRGHMEPGVAVRRRGRSASEASEVPGVAPSPGAPTR